MTDKPDTYFARALADDDMAAGGRFARTKDRATIFPGLPHAPLPAANWSEDPAGLEPPTGEIIDAVPDLGFNEGQAPYRTEDAASLASSPSAPASVSSAETVETEARVRPSSEDPEQ